MTASILLLTYLTGSDFSIEVASVLGTAGEVLSALLSALIVFI